MTIKQLAFRSWQESRGADTIVKSRGASSLEESGPSWDRFNDWWTARFGYIGADDLSIDELTLWQGSETCDIADQAWREAQRDRFTAWWSAIVTGSRA